MLRRIFILYGGKIFGMEREKFGSRLGFILVSAGCAIGIGNVWKFPYLCGQYGGGIFVLFYFLFLILMGIPVMAMELAVGRASRQSAVKGYQALEPAGSKWHIHGWFAIAGCYLLMMYYTVVSGWMLSYFFKFLTGVFSGIGPEGADAVFGNMLASPLELIGFMAVTVVLGFLVCSLGIQKGLERISTYMMSALLVLILVLAVHSLLLPGGMEGVKFYLLPDIGRVRETRLGNVIAAAMNQSFFTLSLGIAAMEIFGSYMSDKFTLGGESIRIAALDTFVALLSGMIIFPACFSYGVQPDAGPALIFLTLPRVFMNMPGGTIWGTLFFLFMSFASFSTVISVFENLISTSVDNFGWSRKKAVMINCVFLLIASLPCALGYNLWSGVHPFPGKDILDSEDYIVSNFLLPLGSLVYVLFCTWKSGWGFEGWLKECNKGEGMKFSAKLKPYLQFVLPLLILAVFIQGLL